jgi:hypothetical protein
MLPRGVVGVVGQVVLEIEHDHQWCVCGMPAGPGGDHVEPVPQRVAGVRVAAGVVDEVSRLVVPDGVVVQGAVEVLLNVQLDEADTVVELVEDRAPGAGHAVGVLGVGQVAGVAVVGRPEYRRGEWLVGRCRPTVENRGAIPNTV